ncbi:transcriptional regulator [Devosia limi]|uniref:transcriptional regulator n=1 Tax=Devosia limi TaxID=288995 RepID=UPI0009339B3A|nr:Cro/CI family transcriptional regulator [Devosia limi]
MENALEAAIKAVGTAQKFAEKIGVTPQAVSQWRRVPALRVLAVEKASGVSRHDLRPDIYPREEVAA